jgi:hypothetical protein
MSTTPAGWYADPTGRSEHRYWDGSRWTEHVSNRGLAGTDPIDAYGVPLDPTVSPLRPVPIATQATGDVRTGIRAVPWWAWAIGVAVLLLVVGTVAIVIPTDDGKEITTSTLETRPTTTTRAPTTTTSSTTTSTTTTTTLPPITTTTVAPAPLPPPPAPPAAAVAPAPATGGCDPNYSGCVPIASDVDCAGGSGNGPAYTGPVQVIVSDIYDLDSDGDGTACES